MKEELLEQEIPEQFYKARRNLILDHCFFGSLVMRLVPKIDTSCESMYTDGKNFGINPEFFTTTNEKELPGVLARGVLYCALEHTLRRGDRDKDLWNDACAYAVNPLILKSGLQLPSDVLINSEYEGMAAEEIYSILKKKKDGQQQQSSSQNQNQQEGQGEGQGEGEGEGEGEGQPSEGEGKGQDTSSAGEVRDHPSSENSEHVSESEKKEIGNEWKIAVQQAVMNAEMEGDMPGALEELVQKLLRSKVNWEEELLSYMLMVKDSDSTWSKPDRRFIGKNLYLPSSHSEEMGCMVLAMDTSGSLSPEVLSVFEERLNALLEEIKPERLIVIMCDAVIQSVEEYTVEDYPVKLVLKGRGGTKFEPVFDWIEYNLEEPPACMVYLTDLLGYFDRIAVPEYPVLWMYTTPEPRRMPPFGELVPLNIYA